MRRELVERRRWLDDQTFLDLYAAAQLIPGPNSTELALHIGWRQARLPGLLVAGTCFILPAVIIVTVFARFYVEYGTLPAVASMLRGIQPVIVGVLAQALWGLGKSALKTKVLTVAAGACLLLATAGLPELAILAGAGALFGAWGANRPTGILRAVAAPLVPLFLAFLKIGSVLFGSGYVLLAFLRADFVERWHWLTEAQLMDAVAVGQFTPGPVFTTATFVGYLLGGYGGAAVATAGIFLPAFVLVALTAPLLPKLRASKALAAALDGINAASWALLAFVGWQLARSAVTGPFTGGLVVASFALLWFFKGSAAWLVLAGAAVGGLAGL